MTGNCPSQACVVDGKFAVKCDIRIEDSFSGAGNNAADKPGLHLLYGLDVILIDVGICSDDVVNNLDADLQPDLLTGFSGYR